MFVLASGVRITEDMNTRLEELIQAGITIPALYHYVKYVQIEGVIIDLTRYQLFRRLAMR